jgi:lantibiotic modifying enzyme
MSPLPSFDSGTRPSRRDLLKGGLAATAAVFVSPALLEGMRRVAAPLSEGERPYLEAAGRAAAWLAPAAIHDDKGMRWAADPRDPSTVSTDLYNGTTGVVPFWLELHHATHAPDALARATAGADFLLQSLPPAATPLGDEGAGLYTGIAGIAWTLAMTHRASGQEAYRDGARRAMSMVAAAARPIGRGVSWSASNDIISGSAGIGLTLLWAADALEDARARELATLTGRRLLDVGIPEQGGTKWEAAPGMKLRYPNFSHGTAGVSYFLATLYAATRTEEFLAGALSGARYLQAIATRTPGDGRMVFHSEPGNEQLFYLSWCHGPAGTARLFHRLAAVTGDASHARYVEQLVTATRDMGVPEKRTPGFWNNISQCCGNCGVTEFLLSLHAQSGDAAQLAWARRIAEDTIARATAEGDGLKWVQAEHRVRPELLVAQTGLMQGAAGVGVTLLHLDGALTGRKPLILLPDNPWSG